jgi:hypothetical protein
MCSCDIPVSLSQSILPMNFSSLFYHEFHANFFLFSLFFSTKKKFGFPRTSLRFHILFTNIIVHLCECELCDSYDARNASIFFAMLERSYPIFAPICSCVMQSINFIVRILRIRLSSIVLISDMTVRALQKRLTHSLHHKNHTIHIRKGVL